MPRAAVRLEAVVHAAATTEMLVHLPFVGEGELLVAFAGEERRHVIHHVDPFHGQSAHPFHIRNPGNFFLGENLQQAMRESRAPARSNTSHSSADGISAALSSIVLVDIGLTISSGMRKSSWPMPLQYTANVHLRNQHCCERYPVWEQSPIPFNFLVVPPKPKDSRNINCLYHEAEGRVIAPGKCKWQACS